jgi:hypothetical protein
MRSGFHTVYVCLDRFVRQDASSVHVHLIRHCHIIAENRNVLQPRPFADSAVPSHDCALDPRMILDPAALKDDTSLKPDTVTNHDTGTNSDIWADAAVLADLR